MKILITGGAGFIGSHLVEQFQDAAEVVVFDNLSTGKRENLEGFRHEFIEGDIKDISAVEKAMDGCEYVFHLAAFISVPESVKNPDECIAVNVSGTENILKAAEKNDVKKVIFSSSCAVYGDSIDLPKMESMSPEPKSPYADSKMQAELLCKKYHQKGIVKTCYFRFFNVYGPRQDPKSQYAAAIPIFIDNALSGRPVTIFGDGKQTRDFIYVKDVVIAFKLAMERLTGLYNVCTGKETSIDELAKLVISLTGSGSEIKYAPVRAGDIIRSYGSISKLKDEDFSPEYSLEKGLGETISWMRSGMRK